IFIHDFFQRFENILALQDLNGIGLLLKQRADRLMKDGVAGILQLMNFYFYQDQGFRILEFLQAIEHLSEFHRRFTDQLSKFFQRRKFLGNTVEKDIFKDILDEIDHVIELLHQQIDIFAIKGRHEELIERRDDLMGLGVPGMFDRFGGGGVLLKILEVTGKFLQ